MKPIKLLIKGLQSFEEEQEIDFQKLSEHGLFGIFGPTGSGKSTILDAITLAIYGDIVRIKGSQADRLEHLVNMNCNEMRVDFTFELGSHVFQIIREMKFKKMERVFSSKKQYLLKDGEIIADKDTQIKSEIDNYIGLSMDDFTRSVVLPQGKFSEFLKLSGTDRRDMLERLFGLQKYGKQMLDKIRKKLAIYQDNISAIDNQILGKGNFSEDELEKNKEILNNLKSEKIQVENFLKTKTDEFKIKENFWNLQKELETLKIEEKRILENKETVKEYKSKIELDIKAKEINTVYENYNSLTKKVEEKEKLSINIKNDSKIIENRLKEEKNNLEILKNSIASFEKEKDSNAVTVIERAKSQEFLNKKNEYLEKKSQESEIIRNISNANSSIEKINSILKNLETEIEENKSNLSLLVEINEAHIMSKEIQIERLETKKIKDLEIKISNLKEKLDLKILEKNNLEKEILLLENNQDLLKEKQNQNLAYQLSKELQDGTPCPCCGSLEHPNIAKISDDDFKDLEQNLLHINKELTNKKIKLESLYIDEIKENIKEVEGELGSRTYEKLKQLENELMRELEALKNDREKYISNKIKFEKELERLNKEKNNSNEKISGLNMKVELHKQELSKLESHIKTLNDYFVSEDFSSENKPDYDKIDTFINNIKERENSLEKLEIEIKRVNQKRENSLIILEKLNEELSTKVSDLHKYIGEIEQLKIQEKFEKEKFENLMNSEFFDSIISVKNSLFDEEKLKTMKSFIENHEKKSAEIHGKINLTKEKLKDNSTNLEELNNLKNIIAEENKKIENIVNLIGQLTVNIEKMTKILSEVKELIDAKKVEEIELNKYQELNKLFIGNAFVEYLALGKLKNIAYIASQRLNKISNGHYALTVNESGDFLIIDNFNNGETRRSATLSGGESFLVSLSLALALSSQIQLKSKSSLEFFFLDEGFGTLDNQLLDRVISSLESLRDNEKMNIGLITHVEELKERVPRKLIVNPPISGECGTKVNLI